MTGPPEFESLVDLYSAELYGYLWRIFGTAPEAEDCLQETFLRAYRAYPRVEKNSNLRAWLYKIATNTANTRLRQQARLERRIVVSQADLADQGPSVPEQVERRQLMRALQQAVERLPVKQRAALILRKYQGLSYADVAEALACSPDSARANVYQALRRLRKLFAPSDPGRKGS